MSRLRYWTPRGGNWITVTPGRVWYSETDTTILLCAVISGAWGGKDYQEKYGPWDENENQVWWTVIRKDITRTYEVTEHFDLPPITYPVWETAYSDLGNKPHRSIGIGLRDGQFFGRRSVPSIEGARAIDWGCLVWYETPSDRRAVRLWAQARVKREASRRRALKRLRDGRSRKVSEENWPGWRRYHRRRAQEDARW